MCLYQRHAYLKRLSNITMFYHYEGVAKQRIQLSKEAPALASTSLLLTLLLLDSAAAEGLFGLITLRRLRRALGRTLLVRFHRLEQRLGTLLGNLLCKLTADALVVSLRINGQIDL